MHLLIDSQGQVTCLYSEAIDLASLGDFSIRRASHVESDARGQWLADLSPVGGPILGPFSKRSQALQAKQQLLERNWLGSGQPIVERS